MPWEEIARRLAELGIDMLEGINSEIIQNALENPDFALQLTDSQLQEIEEAIFDAESQLDAEAIADFPEEVPDGLELPILAGTIGFFFRKQITDGIRSIHGATIANQILDVERTEQQQAALDRAKLRIANAAHSESSSAFALKHQEIALDSDFAYYRYHTSEDGVVRPAHVSRNQRVFRYGGERIVDDIPGMANNCRCFSEPLTLQEALQGTFFYPDDRPNIQSKGEPEKMKKKFAKFNVRSENNVVTIDVEGVIDFWEGNDYDSFSRKVNAYIENDSQELVINVTSYGGNGEDSMRAYDLLKGLPNKVTANIYGYAGSAATHFVVAADFATIGESDNFFIHQAWTCPCGNKEQLLDVVDSLEEFDEQQINIYMQKTGMNREDTESLLKEERIISAQEAKDFGFIDEIRPDSNRSKAARGESVAQANYSALVQARQPTSIEGQTMKFEELLAAISAASDEIKAQLYASLSLVSQEDSDESQATAVSAIQAKLDDATTQLAAKDSVIQAAQKSADKEDESDAEDKLRIQIRAEIEEEAKAKDEISTQVQKAGLKVEGETANEILASAVEQAGGASQDSEGTRFGDVVLKQIWASIVLVRGQSENADEINALGTGTETPAGKPAIVAGSRADRINNKT